MAEDQIIAAVVADYKEALRAVDELRGQGFSDEDISVVARDSRPVVGAELPPPGEASEAAPADSVVRGAESGGLIGAGLGFLAGFGALLIPGLGPIVAAGPLLGALGGAAAGAATGSFVGLLIDLGIPERQARAYAERLHSGGVLVTAHTDDEEMAEQALAILQRYENLAHRPVPTP